MSFFQQIFGILQKYGYVYAQGLWGTLWISALTIVIASVLGTIIAILKMSRVKIIKGIVNAYIEAIRGTPMLLQMYFFWLILPRYMPFEVTDTQAIVVALIINATAYVAEVIRAGVQAVDKSQTEAALSLGTSRSDTFIKVICKLICQRVGSFSSSTA